MPTILAAGDFHGELTALLDLLDRVNPDLLLSPGDWADPDQLSRQSYQAVLDRVPVITVYGNHDDRRLLETLWNRDGPPVLLPPAEILNWRGFRIAGISGIWAKSHLGARLTKQWEHAARKHPGLSVEEWLGGRLPPPYVTDEDVEALALQLAREAPDLLITHGCALGLADLTPSNRRGGQRCFRMASETVNPRVHLCGHLHRFQSSERKDGGLVLNCGSGAAGEAWLIRTEDWSAEPAVSFQPRAER